MKKHRIATAFSLFLLSISTLQAQRTDRIIDDGWTFRFSHEVEASSERSVTLPHTWNADDALQPRPDYKRGIGNYRRTLAADELRPGRRHFLRFEGANSVADVFVDGRHVAEHRGGYGAFAVELTPYVGDGRSAEVLVRVNNAERLDVMPLVGDFNFYGGLYRDVHLLETAADCIDPTFYGSSGVWIAQDTIGQDFARVTAHVRLSLQGSGERRLSLRFRVSDGENIVAETTVPVTTDATTASQTLSLNIRKPHLWDGRRDPFCYQTTTELLVDGQPTDCVRQPLGLRTIRIDPQQGFFLNGRHLALHGVCRHQDRDGKGNALLPTDHDEDARLIADIGANAVRLAHYPQAERFYTLMDSLGIVVWAEIPFVGPGGYADKGYVATPDFEANGLDQLRELILQHGNHPSICLWGLFNELKEVGDNPCDYISRLNDLAHHMDPSRPTTAASNQQGRINFITDAMAWNRYDGWYGGQPADLGRWIDNMHEQHPTLPIAISEYGAGASISQQQDTLQRPVPTSAWHPENWQTYYHMENWRTLSCRPFVWGTFVWNMFDFGAAHRHEGSRLGLNDKGLVSFDRQTPKDAFYFYKANWRDDVPVLHLAEKRCTVRTRPRQTFTVFTNLGTAELFVDGKSQGRRQTDAIRCATWTVDNLTPGQHHVRVEARQRRHVVADEASFTLTPNP